MYPDESHLKAALVKATVTEARPKPSKRAMKKSIGVHSTRNGG
jgi:hypothetical protein